MDSDTEFQSLYDVVGNDPYAWTGKAVALLHSADILVESFHASIPPGAPADEAEAVRRMRMQQVFVMLRGMGVECLLKAVWVKRVKQLAVGGKLQKPVSTNPHDLVVLESALDQHAPTGLSVAERTVLARLSMQIMAGRYPIGMHALQSTTLPKGSGPRYLMRWTEEDQTLFESLVGKLSGLMAEVS